MSNLVIVAIPEQDDYVWKISSEKVPHMTILYLGDPTKTPNVAKMIEFLEHASDTVLDPFWLNVEDRGTLGDDDADVVFFEGWDVPVIKNFRAQLLQNESIRKAYDLADQHPDWLPHLTLGYPDSPAKSDEREYPGIRSVRFNKIALWYGNYEGAEFKLKENYNYPLEVAMGDVKEVGAATVEDVLSHHGVKGMKWGVRKDRKGSSQPKVEQKGKKLKAKGGGGHTPHEDAVSAATLGQKAKASGLHSLSNEELFALQTRMNLEQNVRRLNSGQSSGGKKFVTDLLKNVGKNQAQRLATEIATRQVEKTIKKKAK